MGMTFMRFLFLLLIVSAAAAVAQAQATRTWVSGVGDDVNPCSRTAPCKTFAGAISKTAANGEINCIDSGGFGTVTITKSIIIDCSPVTAGVLAAGTNGILINIPAPPAGSAESRRSVTLRGLSINGAGTGTNGVRVVAAANVYIEGVTIDGFVQNGVAVAADSGVSVVVKDSTIRNNTAAGIITTGSGPSSVVVAGSLIAGNASGVVAGAGSTVRLADNLIVHNAVGISATGTGRILSARDNVIDGNGTSTPAAGPSILQ